MSEICPEMFPDIVNLGVTLNSRMLMLKLLGLIEGCTYNTAECCLMQESVWDYLHRV